MNYGTLGRSGLLVSELCLGSWINFGDGIGDAEAFGVLNTAFEEGINFFDTADVYAGGKAEEVIGRWMKTHDRREIVLATKCRGWMWDGPNGNCANRKHIIAACDDSLRRLQTDYIDLYQIHWPDPHTPADEQVRALDDLVRAGKIIYFGWSNYDAKLIEQCGRISDNLRAHHAISLQCHYNMLTRDVEKDIVPTCEKEGIGLLPYSPLAQGLLSDKYLMGEAPLGSRGKDNADFEARLRKYLPTMRDLSAIAKQHTCTLSQLALAWLLHQPNIAAPIVGATKADQIKENVKATNVKLSANDLKLIAGILETGGAPARQQQAA